MCCANVTGMEKKTFLLSGNTHIQLFCIENLVSQRKHLDSDKHMNKNLIDIERNKSVEMVYVLCVCLFLS